MVLLLWIIYVSYVSCLSCFLVYSLQLCGHLLGKGYPLGSFVCDFLLCFVIFSCVVLGQGWYFIVSIPDLTLTFGHEHNSFGGLRLSIVHLKMKS